MTKPNTPDEMIAVIQAFKEGEKIEYKFVDENNWHACQDPCWDFLRTNYRVKPTKKTVPWTADDVPPVCWVRWMVSGDSWYQVAAVNQTGTHVWSGRLIEYRQLATDCEYSTDLKTWKPCTKEVLE
jgi:hypothetical protein